MPNSDQRPPLPRLKLSFPRWSSDWRLWASITGLLLVAALVLSLVTARQELDRLRAEQRCRSELASDVSFWQSRNAQAVGDGLAAFARDDEEALQASVVRQEAASVQLDAALEARITTDCR